MAEAGEQRSERERRPLPRKVLWAIALAAVVLGATVLLVRGVVPAVRIASDDFRVIYISSRAWVHGANPYDAASLDGLWLGAHGPADHLPSKRGSRDLLYPPPTFVVSGAVGALDWPVAKVVWAGLNLAAVLGAIIGAASLAGLRWREPAAWIFAGAAMGLAPIVTGIKVGQMMAAVTALIAGGHALRVAGRPVAGGMLLGLAAVCKPQIGLIFVAYEVFRWRWRLAGPALAVVLVAAAVGIGRLEAAGVPWLETLSGNVKEFTTGAGNANPLPENPHRHQMIDLRPVVHNFTDNRTVGTLAVLAVAGVLAIAGLAVWMRRLEDPRELIALSIGGVGGLMIAYHRFYDASVLVLPLAWVVWAFWSPQGRAFGWTRWMVVLGLLVFAAPGAVALNRFAPASMRASLLFDTFVMHHQAWALLWLTVWLILALNHCPRRETPAFPWLPGAKRPRV